MQQMPLVIMTLHGFEINVNRKGKLKIIQGYEDYYKSLLKNMDYTTLPKGSKKFLKKYVSDSIGNQALIEMLQDEVKPDNPVGIGESWQKTSVFTKSLPLISNSTLTLKDCSQGIFTIEKTSKIYSNLNVPPSIVFNNYALRYEFTGEDRGTVLLSDEDGILIRSEINRQLSGEFKAVKGPKDFKNKSWPFTLRATTITEYLHEGITFKSDSQI
jgi:Family of unknown function (DUF6263)